MHCAKKGEEEKKTDIKGTVPARLETKLASNKTRDSTKLQVLRALIIGVDETTRLSSRFFFPRFSIILQTLPKGTCTLGLVSQPGRTESSYFYLRNLGSIAPYA